MPVFGTKSKEQIATLHKDLQLIHFTAIQMIRTDYGVHQGARTFEQQLEYFLDGKSKLDPRKPGVLKSAKHVVAPGMRDKAEASDFHISEKHNNETLTWNKDHLIHVAGYLMGVADVLFQMGKISHRLRWGGDWNMNGTIIIDQTFDDLPHVELYKP